MRQYLGAGGTLGCTQLHRPPPSTQAATEAAGVADAGAWGIPRSGGAGLLQGRQQRQLMNSQWGSWRSMVHAQWCSCTRMPVQLPGACVAHACGCSRQQRKLRTRGELRHSPECDPAARRCLPRAGDEGGGAHGVPLLPRQLPLQGDGQAPGHPVQEAPGDQVCAAARGEGALPHRSAWRWGGGRCWAGTAHGRLRRGCCADGVQPAS